jgi:hypothetical protein
VRYWYKVPREIQRFDHSCDVDNADNRDEALAVAVCISQGGTR